MAGLERKKCEACGTWCANDAAKCWNCGHVFGESVSEEEKENVAKGQILAPEATEENALENNVVATILKALAYVVYAVAFLAGILLGKDLKGDPSFILMLVYWIAGLFAGTMLLGFSEVIRLLHEINRKTK